MNLEPAEIVAAIEDYTLADVAAILRALVDRLAELAGELEDAAAEAAAE